MTNTIHFRNLQGDLFGGLTVTAAIVIMVILTTFLAPPLLRFAFKQSLEEKEALEKANFT
ncbi:hypothetical protein [Nostoc commune]|uniref:hypothetical protein n=1 Tax=Nostoc commune TaxID=1178 RepID=UPI0018C7FADB|nr:hypothetical protein [Nostoc commune]